MGGNLSRNDHEVHGIAAALDRGNFWRKRAVVIIISRGVVISESISGRVRLFKYSVCQSTFQYLFAGNSYLPQLDLLLGFYSELG